MFKLFVILTVGMLGAAAAWGGLVLWGTAVSLVTLLAVWTYSRYGFLHIPEMEVGVVFSTAGVCPLCAQRSPSH